MKDENPEITIATVCYNLVGAGRVNPFRNCIESVRSQTYGSVEHLVVDGGSIDGTVDVIREYTHKGFRWVSEKDNGIYDAMNKAIKLARGKYLAFINTDDMLSDNGALAAVMKALGESGADFVYANANVYSQDHSQFLRVWQSRIDEIPYGYYPCHQTIFCRTETLRKLGGFTETYMANDNLLMLKLVNRYKANYIDRVVVNFHEGGVSAGMIADKARMKDETVSFFYNEVGKKLGLTLEECALLYEKQCFYLPREKVLDLGVKLGNPLWIRRYFDLYVSTCEHNAEMERQNIVSNYERSLNDAHKVVRFKLFGKIPIFRVDL